MCDNLSKHAAQGKSSVVKDKIASLIKKNENCSVVFYSDTLCLYSTGNG